MGFGASFNVIKRAPNCTFEEMLEAKRKAYFETSEWLSKNYPSYEEYVKTNSFFEKRKSLPVSDDLVEFYKNNHSIEIESWCSSARSFDDEVCSLLKGYSYEYFEVDAESLPQLIEFAQTENDKHEIVPITVTHGIKYLENDEDDEHSVKLIPLDGIQIEFEDGSIRQLYNEYDYDMIFACKSLADIEHVYLYESLLKCVLKLKEYNMDEYFIYYSRG